MSMPTEQLRILQHSLGRDGYGRGTDYRNHYCAGGDTIPTCDELVALGYMRKSRLSGSALAGGDNVYHVTDIGKEYVAHNSAKPPKVSRDAGRYALWLSVRDCFPDWKFKDWLKAGGYKQEVRERWDQESKKAYERGYSL